MMRTRIRRALFAAAAGAALTTLGMAGISAAGAATAAPQPIGPFFTPAAVGFTQGVAGYQTDGRWFRFVSTTLTVSAPTVPDANAGVALIGLASSSNGGNIAVAPGGGSGSVFWFTAGQQGAFNLSPSVGDKLTISVFYDRKGHDFFTATDLTQNKTQTVKVNVGTITYNSAGLAALVLGTVDPPAASTPMWNFTGSHVTTYTGDKGTITGPWATTPLIATSTGNSHGTVVASPTALANGGQDFTAMLRPLPRSYTTNWAGYATSGGRWFRYVAASFKVPAAATPAANGGTAVLALSHTGGTAPPFANIQVIPGGGAGSIRYATNTGSGAFAIVPAAGDTLSASIFYDQAGHNKFTVTDVTTGKTQTIIKNASRAITAMPYTVAKVYVRAVNSAITTPAADTPMWAFTGSRVTTYTGSHGTILGPWASSQLIDTTNGTATGTVVMSPGLLTGRGQIFTVYLRH
jgi:hypothetical protein